MVGGRSLKDFVGYMLRGDEKFLNCFNIEWVKTSLHAQGEKILYIFHLRGYTSELSWKNTD